MNTTIESPVKGEENDIVIERGEMTTADSSKEWKEIFTDTDRKHAFEFQFYPRDIKENPEYLNGKFAIDKEKEMELNGEKLICFYRDDTGEIEIIKRKDYSNYVDWNEDRTRYNAFGWNRKILTVYTSDSPSHEKIFFDNYQDVINTINSKRDVNFIEPLAESQPLGETYYISFSDRDRICKKIKNKAQEIISKKGDIVSSTHSSDLLFQSTEKGEIKVDNTTINLTLGEEEEKN